MEIVDRARRFWSALTPSQKILLGLVGALVAVSIVWGSSSAAGQPMVRLVGPEVDDEARGRALLKLKQSNQPHEARDREIWVPSGDAQRVWLELMGEGVMSPQAVWKLVLESDPWATGRDREKRSQIATQQYLEMMIRKVEAVRSASVVINPAPESGALFRGAPRASASVLVELHPGREFTTKNAVAIAGLVASAVPGLDRDRVHLVADGKPCRVGQPDSAAEKADSLRDFERSMELDIERRIAGILPMISLMVRIKAKAVDSESKEIKRERPQVLKEEERKRIEKGPSQAAPPSIKGDVPVAPPAPPAPPVQDTELRTESVFAHETTTQKRDPAGSIEKITVSALYPYAVDKEGKETGQPGPSLEDVKSFIVKAAGPPCSSEDVSVIRVPTRAPEALPDTAPVVGAFAWLSAHWTKIALFAFAALGLAIMFRIVRGATAGGEVEEIRALATSLGEAVQAASRPAEGEPGPARQGLRDLVRQNPEAVAASLKTWMEAR